MKLSAQNKSTLFITAGVLVTLLWILLLLTGMLVNSSYYRAAISFGYAGLDDWLWALFSFTLSNVAILAFLSGLIGGISSKISSTRGFTVTEAELAKKDVSTYLYENPFMSAFRGVFLFVAVLTLQYLSSFTDIGNIQTPESAPPKLLVNNDSTFYLKLKSAISDTASRESIDSIWKQTKDIPFGDPNDFIVRKIFVLTDSCSKLKHLATQCKGESEYNCPQRDQALRVEQQIREFRTQVKLPPTDNIPGMSLISYFKFAMIISLLAFISGYDPSRFNEFLLRVPFLGGGREAKKPE